MTMCTSSLHSGSSGPWPVLIPRRVHFSSISSHSSNMNCLCGLTDAPKEYRKSDMVSLDHIPESSSLYEQVMAA